MVNAAISVALSVYNGERFLAEAIDSILAQTRGDFEFLILDDGSSDASASIVASYARRDSRIVPIMRENRGLIVSLNELLSRAKAPLLARMDADDIAHPERFARQAAFLAEHADHGVVGSWSQDMDEHGADLHRAGRDQPVTHEEMLDAMERGEQVICHPAAMIRTQILREVGGYHRAYRHCEDYDLWLRLAGVTKLANIPERLLRYRRSPDQVSSRHATEQHIGTAVARLAYHERQAGRPDPTATLAELPAIAELDEVFGRAGVSRAVRETVALGLRYSPHAMRGAGFELLVEHLRNGGRGEGMWRTVVRLLRFGEPGRACRLAAQLVSSRAAARDNPGT